MPCMVSRCARYNQKRGSKNVPSNFFEGGVFRFLPRVFYNGFIKYEGGLSVDWKRIKTEYIAGGISLRELSEKYGVSFSTIQKKSMEEKWGDLRKKSRRKVEEKIIDSVSSKEAKKAVDLFEIADLLADKVREIAETVVDPDAIKKLTSAIKDIRDIKGVKTEADIREQEARIKNLERQVEKDGADGKPSGVLLLPMVMDLPSPPMEGDDG